MGHERWFRGQHDGRHRPFDWLTAARQHGIPDKLARALYEQVVQQAHGETEGRVQELYLALLADARRDTARPSPGKVTRTMRLQAHQAGKRRRPHISRLTGQPITAGKHTLTSYLEPAGRESPAPQTKKVPEANQAQAGRAQAVLSRTTRLPEQEISVPGTAAYRRFQATLAAAFGHFEELDALEEERIHPDSVTAAETSRSNELDGGDSAASRAPGWPLHDSERPFIQAFTDATEGTPEALPHQSEVEVFFGKPMAGISAYTGRDELDTLRARGAAMGRKVAFRERNPSLSLVVHEVTHVLQQGGAEVALAASRAVADEHDPAEREADAAAAAVRRHAPGNAPFAVRSRPSATLHLDRDGDDNVGDVPSDGTSLTPVTLPQREQPSTPGPDGGPQSGDPQSGGPQSGGPQSGDLQSGGLQPGGPQPGGPQPGGLQSGGPQPGGPQPGGPQPGGPQPGGPQPGGLQSSGPQPGGPQPGGPQPGGPQPGGPQRGPQPVPALPGGFAVDPRVLARPAQVRQAKAEITLAGETAKNDLTAAAAAEKEFGHQAITDHSARVGQGFDTALQQVDAAHTREVGRINGDRDTQVTTLTEEARRTLMALAQLVTDKQADVRGRGERKAQAATDLGETQARRVLDASAAKQRECWAIASRKAAQYRSEPRGPLIERRINEATRSVVDRIQQDGDSLAAKLRKDGTDLAAKFRREASTSAEEIGRLAGTAREGVERERDEAIRSIRQIATDNVQQLDRAHSDVVRRLDEARTNALAPLDAAPAQLDLAIDQAATTAASQIDDATRAAHQRIDDGEAQAAPKLALLSGLALTEALTEADAAIASAITDHRTSLTGFVGDARTAMHTTANDGATRLGQGADRAIEPLAQMVSDFDAAATRLGTDMLSRSAQIATQATGGWATRVTEARTRIESDIQTLDGGWQRQLDQARHDMTSEADRGIAGFASTVSSLPGDLDTVADRIKSESLLSRIWNGFVGFVKGILDRLWELLKGLLMLVLLVLAIVVVLVIIGVIVFFVGGPAALLAYVLGVVAVVVAVAGFIAAAATIIIVVLAIVTIGLSLLENLPVILDPRATDEERWRAIGRLFTDVVLSIFAEKIFSWLGKLLGRIGRLVGIVGADEARLARLLALVGGDEARLRALVGAFGGDAAKLERMLGLIGNDAAMLERLLGMMANDGLRLERLLGLVGNDAVRLQGLIRTFGNDAALLERCLGALGGDVARAEALLAKMGNDARLFDELLAAIGEDGALLERLTGMVGSDATAGARLKELLRLAGGDTAALEHLLGHPQFTGNAARLERVLNAADDIPQVERLLTSLGNDGQMLEDYLRLSGATKASGVAAELEGLVNFAKSRGAAPADLADLMGIAAGDAAKFRKMAEQARRFGSPRAGAPNPQPGNLADVAGGPNGFSGANTVHYLERHTYSFFDITDIKPNNTFFPPGTTPADIVADLEMAIDMLRAQAAGGALPPTGQMGLNVNGKWVQIGWRPVPPPGGPRFIGQFFPGSGAGIENIPGNVMRAIAKIIGP